MSAVPDVPVDDGHCIGCGKLSAIGLKMSFAIEDDRSVESRISVGPTFAGWRGIVHGGIVALLLDEAMAYAAAAHGVVGMTGELKIRFRESVLVDTPLAVRGEVLWQRRGILGVSARVEREDGGTLLASGEGRFVKRGDVEPGTFGESRFRARS